MVDRIPKIIHYCWFGKKKKDQLILKCLQSWKKNLPNYEIREWNEENFPVDSFEFTRWAYQKKKWAFVADYVRLFVLYEHGGIYLDTDMLVLKDFSDFLHYDLVLGKEDERYLSAGMIASEKKHPYLKNLIIYYDSNPVREPIPKVLTRLFEEYLQTNNLSQENLEEKNIKVFEAKYFYPFDQNQISKFNYYNAPKESYAVHLWSYSWGHPLNKVLKKLGLYRIIKYLTEKLALKEKIKKILQME